MNIATMRRVDRWIGVPLCAALSIAARAARLISTPREGTVNRILFVKLAEQGSTVLAAPAIRRAVSMVGRENVYFLAFEENRFILDIMDLIPRENVISIRADGVGATLGRSLAAVRELRRLRLDAAIDLEFFARSSAIFALLSGARRRVGFHASRGEGPYRGDLMTHKLRFNPHMHTSETFRFMVDALGADATQLPTTDLPAQRRADVAPRFTPDEQAVTRVRGIIDEAGGVDRGGPFVLLNANCSDLIPLRAWPRDKYVELASRLIEAEPEIQIAFTGAPSEAIEAEKLIDRIGSDRCVCLAGRTSLEDLLVVYSVADVLVTNDSGPAHFATLTPIDVVTLFGPEHPALFAARSPRNHVVWAGLACSPCVSALNNRESHCSDNLCMQEISVQTVFDTVIGVIRDRRSGRTRDESVSLEVVTRPQVAPASPIR